MASMGCQVLAPSLKVLSRSAFSSVVGTDLSQKTAPQGCDKMRQGCDKDEDEDDYEIVIIMIMIMKIIMRL